jgi:putative membrane protein (TIGR04086 family)
MNKVKKEQTKTLTILKALLVSYMISGAMLLLLALILYKVGLPGRLISVGIIFSYIFSAFAGGLIIGKSVKEKRFIWGVLIGFLYFMVIFLVSVVMNKSVFGQGGSTFTVFIMCSLGGMLGGMIS